MAKDQKDEQTIDAFPRRRGRPRKYASDAERVRAHRRRKSAEMIDEGGAVRRELVLRKDIAMALEEVARAKGISQSDLAMELLKDAGLLKMWVTNLVQGFNAGRKDKLDD